MDEVSGEITRILSELRNGNSDSLNRLLEIVYGQLKAMAARYLRQERPDHTLQTTALVNELYVRLAGNEINWQNRAHFFAVAAQVMRRILVDHARAHLTAKRGQGRRVELEENLVYAEDRSYSLVALDDALSRLAKFDARQSRIVEMRFFGGLTEDETAAVLGISARTVKRDWRIAKAWLYGELGQ